MWGFQLLGWVASSTNYNFNDWAFTQAHPDKWVINQNLAGGGIPDTITFGSKAAVEGNTNLYLQPWPADSTAAILDHWFGPGGLGLDSTKLRYWNMDNEIEIWNGTHDDVDSLLSGHMITAEETVQRWIAVAKAARKLFPGIKLVGPASASEWQWYTWPGEISITYKGVSYCWPEYLIKRLAEAQDSSGVRMLDVYDVHLYLQGSTKSQVQQQYRLLWDTTYLDPNANGVRALTGDWNSSNPQHQMFFHRVEGWLDKHFGKGHGITVGATESGLNSLVKSNPSEVATWYASILGTFADHGGELFTPWDWGTGMWEVLHLFSRYAKTVRVQSTSSMDSLVSAYSSTTPTNDSMTVILVNRDAATQNVTVSLKNFVPNGNGVSLQLANLTGETFTSHTQNALQSGTVTVSNGAFSINLPSYSVTAVRFAVLPVPNAPQLSAPGNNSTNIPVALDLTWNAATGASTYRQQLSTDTAFSSIIVDDSALSLPSKSVSSLQKNTKYYWRVNATNAGGTSSWSDVWNFSTLPPVSGVPQLAAPGNNSTNNPVALDLTWNAVTGASTYRLQLSTDTAFSSIVVNDSALSLPSKSVSTLQQNTKYYWRVNATNAGGTSPWSDVWQFSTLIPIPNSITVIGPINSAVIGSDSVSFNWHKGLPNVDMYNLEIYTDSLLTNLFHVDSLIADTFNICKLFANNISYYWRVKAHNIAGWGPFCSLSKFTISIPSTSILPKEYSLNFSKFDIRSKLLSFALPNAADVKIKIYSIQGKLLYEYSAHYKNAGFYNVPIKISSISRGKYILDFQAETFNIRKMFPFY